MPNYTLDRSGPGKPWQCYFQRRDGSRFRKSTKETDKARAHVIAREWERVHADPTYKAANEITVGRAARNLEVALESRGLSE
jgi:hypothetical protein